MYDELDNAFDAVIDMIKYLSNSTIFTLEQKTKFFWKYIKGFLKITGISKGNKFQILKEGFDSMIVEQIMLNDDEQNVVSMNKDKEAEDSIYYVNFFEPNAMIVISKNNISYWG